MADTVKGVDISVHNGEVDFEMLKRNGISFVMIGMGNRFAENVQKAEAAGMPWGGYFYTDSVSPAEDEEELAKILDRLKGKRPTYPIAIDVEDDGTKAAKGGWNYANVNRNAKFLLEGLEKAGYYPMLYTGFEEIENYIDESVWRKYDMWWAQWATRCGYPGDNLGMWQFGGEQNFISSPYIEGEIFDQNYAYKDYPTIIKSGGWNNWGTPEPLPDYPDDDFPPYQNGTVKDVQEWLNSAYGESLEVDGICGYQTKKALISALQAILNDTYGAGLDVDGIFGRKTKTAIRNLSNGDTGDYVRVLQGFLIGRGQDTGGFDGIFGNETESAVRTFQLVKRLTVDGIAGKNTFERLAND